MAFMESFKYNSKMISESPAPLGHRLLHPMPLSQPAEIEVLGVTLCLEMMVLSKDILILLYFACNVLEQRFLLEALDQLQLSILSHQGCIRLVQFVEVSTEGKAGRAVLNYLLHLYHHYLQLLDLLPETCDHLVVVGFDVVSLLLVVEPVLVLLLKQQPQGFF